MKIKLNRMVNDNLVTEWLYVISIDYLGRKASCQYYDYKGNKSSTFYTIDELYAILLFGKPLNDI